MAKVMTRIVLIVLACCMLTACAPKTLESIFNQSDNKKMLDEQIEQIKESPSNKSTYSDVKWSAKGNDLSFEYYYAKDLTDDQIATLKSSIDAQHDGLKSVVDNLKDSIEKELKIRPESINYIYFTKDGKEITRLTY